MNLPEGLHLIQTPVPYPLKFVNCYLCETKDGWVLVDAGCNTADTQAFWEKTFQDYGVSGNNLTDVYVTHYHPDHLGAAGWLQAQYGPRVHMHPPDHEWAVTQWEPSVEQAYLVESLYVRNGCEATVAQAVRNQFIDQRNDTVPLPEQVVPMHPGERITLGNGTYEVLWVPGHADGMVGFWNRDERVFVAADSILPHITPNVGLWPRCRPNPLSDFLDSLGKIRDLDPVLTLPGHGKTMTDAAMRATFIIGHHEERLNVMLKMVGEGLSSAFDVARRYFEIKELTAHQVRFAMSETLAHMEYLAFSGQVDKIEDERIRYVPAGVVEGGARR